jgi:putative intracellular protease/amidase
MRIAVLLYEGMTALDAIGPYEVLRNIPNAEVCFVAEKAGPVVVDSKVLSLVATHTLSSAPTADIIVVPGGTAGTFEAVKNEVILNWLRKAHTTSRWTTSVCTGSLILGAAGLLKGLKATTHWAARDMLSGYQAEYVAERFVEQGKIITAAGVSAGIDMALYLAAQVAGDTAAQCIQLAIEYDPQPPFDSGSMQKASPGIVRMVQATFGFLAVKEYL